MRPTPDQFAALEHCRALENLASNGLFDDEVIGLMWFDDLENLRRALTTEVLKRVERVNGKSNVNATP